MKQPILTQEIVRSLLRYSRRTGVFMWRRRSDVRECWNTRYAHRPAGSRWSPDGKTYYIVIRIFNYPFLAHRLAVLYVTGEWPTDDVDHRDLNGINNRWKNIRCASKSENGLNRRANRNSLTGIKGVSPQGDCFRATIQVAGRWRQIGIFKTLSGARIAYRRAVKENAGSFGRIE